MLTRSKPNRLALLLFYLATILLVTRATEGDCLYRFYARKQNASRVYSLPSSGRLSVTLVNCTKTVQARITKFSLWLPQGL